jgi:hypothetical protein
MCAAFLPCRQKPFYTGVLSDSTQAGRERPVLLCLLARVHGPLAGCWLWLLFASGAPVFDVLSCRQVVAIGGAVAIGRVG